ncbi:MAG: hypothetical protein ACLS29_08485 [Prevotellamassilia sp.]
MILTGTETGLVTMVPAAAEAVAKLTGNQLGQTAGATKVVTENLYVLGKSGENVGFFKAKANTKLGMNKAYLMSTTSQPPSNTVWQRSDGHRRGRVCHKRG